jgi:hypothetical protein
VRILGWIILAVFLADALASGATDLAPSLLTATHAITGVSMLLSVVSLMLAIIGRPKPRAPFFLVPAFYALAIAAGVAVTVLLIQKIGMAGLRKADVTPELLAREFPWFQSVTYAIHLLHLVAACWALLAFAREQQREALNPATSAPMPPSPSIGT